MVNDWQKTLAHWRRAPSVATTPPSSEPVNRPAEPEDDAQLYRQALQGVQPLPYSPVAPPRPIQRDPRQLRLLRQHASQESSPILQLSDAEAHHQPLYGDDPVLHVRAGLQHQRLKRLQQGLPLSERPAGPALDLHGLSVDQARSALFEWIRQLKAEGSIQALLITGKGKPGQPATLKSHAVCWLKQMHEVIAFCSAQAADGGRGALYILIRNRPS